MTRLSLMLGCVLLFLHHSVFFLLFSNKHHRKLQELRSQRTKWMRFIHHCVWPVCVFCPSSHRGHGPPTGRAQRVWDLLAGGSFAAPAGHREDRAHRQVVQGPEDPLPAKQPHPQDRWDSFSVNIYDLWV